MTWRKLSGALAVLVTLVAVVAAVRLSGSDQETGAAASGQYDPDLGPARARTGLRPDIVMVLLDDASYDLFRTMPQARKMQAQGASYPNSHVVDSLCCPSRASIFTGRPPHQTGVLTNTAVDLSHPIGGYRAFVAHHNADRTFNLALQRSGYTTGFIGKYLNGYDVTTEHGKYVPPPRLPGWDHFDAILGGGYPEWDFWSARQDGPGPMRLTHNAKPPRNSPVAVLDRHYATNVESDDAMRFLAKHRNDTKPYFLEVATYAPHAQMHHAYPGNPSFPPAFADRPRKGHPGGNCGTVRCRKLSVHDLRGYADPRADNQPVYLQPDGGTSPAPPWNQDAVTLTDKHALREYRDRVRMVQAVDRMVARIRSIVGPNTYVVLTSDNGYHLGQLQLNGGKSTPYDFDTRVPLLITGPGVTPGPRSQFVSNIDLAPTFEQMAGITPPASVSGVSFLQSLHDPHAASRHYAFFDHTGGAPEPGEVDGDVAVGGDLGEVPSYIGVRGPQGLLVRFDLDRTAGHRYAWELYDYRTGFEQTNVFAQDHDLPWARELMRRLQMWDRCRPAECRAAAR